VEHILALFEARGWIRIYQETALWMDISNIAPELEYWLKENATVERTLKSSVLYDSGVPLERYGPPSGSIRPMDERDLLTLESAVTAIEEAATAVAREVERDRLRETSLARLSTVEAELNRSRLTLEKIIREETG
jgi:hypothetical protein